MIKMIQKRMLPDFRFKNLFLLSVLCVTHVAWGMKTQINHFKLTAAGVLPVIYGDNKKIKYAVVGREVNKPNNGKYCYFSGSAEKDTNPLVVAAKEWWEEAILGHALELTKKDVQEYIKQNTVGCVVLGTQTGDLDNRTYGVMYLVDFTKYKNTLLFNFNTAYDRAKKEKKHDDGMCEMDTLALVEWNEIVKEKNEKKEVSAEVLQRGDFLVKEQISLRDIFSLLIDGLKKNKYNVGSNNDADSVFPEGCYVIGSKKENNTYSERDVDNDEKKLLYNLISAGFSKKSLHDSNEERSWVWNLLGNHQFLAIAIPVVFCLSLSLWFYKK